MRNRLPAGPREGTRWRGARPLRRMLPRDPGAERGGAWRRPPGNDLDRAWPAHGPRGSGATTAGSRTGWGAAHTTAPDDRPPHGSEPACDPPDGTDAAHPTGARASATHGPGVSLRTRRCHAGPAGPRESASPGSDTAPTADPRGSSDRRRHRPPNQPVLVPGSSPESAAARSGPRVGHDRLPA